MEERPVGDRGVLQLRVIAFGDGGSVCQIVHVRARANEVQVRAGEGLKATPGFLPRGRHRGAGLVGRLLQPGTGDRGQETTSGPEVHVGRLMAHARAVGDLPQAQRVRRLTAKASNAALTSRAIRVSAALSSSPALATRDWLLLTVSTLWHSLFVDDRSWDRLIPHLSELRRRRSPVPPPRD